MRTGEVIDARFVVEKFVARGGMGDIYRARDRSTGRPIALKLIGGDDNRMAARLFNEAQALNSLAHPAVVRYVAHGVSSEHGHYLAMEWLDGVTLWERLQAAPLTLDESLTLGARIADGLGVAHARGMVHRDVKPLNLLLVGGRVNQVKILDFGIVRLGQRHGITATGAGIGTPDYMAPEQARGERGVGPPADVFSLGCVLFKCLTGQVPFKGEHVAAILAKVAMLEKPPRAAEVRPELPQLVNDLVARMMAHRAVNRPADGAAAAALIRETQRKLAASGGVTIRAPRSLTRRELQPISVLFVDLGIGAEPGRLAAYAPTDPAIAEPAPHLEGAPVLRGPSDTWRILPLVRRALEPHGARVEPLLEGSLVAMLGGAAALTDLAVRSARGALAVRALLPDASVGVATLQAQVDDGAAVGDVIDGAVTRVRPGSKTIRIDRRTQTLLPERFEVRGDDEGGFELLGERDAPAGARDSARRLLGRETPFIGRNRTLRQLVAMYAGCVEDRAAQAVVIVGEAGVGKTRLRAELLSTLAREPAPPALLFARGDPMRAQLPFGALARALLALLAPAEPSPAVLARAVAARLPEPDARRVAEFLGEICGVEFPADDSPPLRAARQDPALMADQRRRAFEDWLIAECHTRPVLIVVEDMQWVDHATIELVASGLRRARDLPLLVVALARHEASERFPHLGKDWERQEIRLEPLRPADCAELLRVALGDAIDAELARRLVERSAGNPFFLEELIRAAAAGETTVLPDTVLGSVQLRLARLSEPARQALRAASIYGATFRAHGVAHLLGRDASVQEVAARLDLLAEEELLRRLSSGGYAFRHDLVRQAAYRMLTDADRRIGHRLAGEWLIEAGETDPVVLAEHFAGGGAIEQAIEWFQRAAEEALGDSVSPAATDAADALRKAATHFRRAGEVCAAAYVNENAIAFYERAVALWASLDTREAGRARLACARLREGAGQRERAAAEIQLAEAEAERSGDVRTRIEALLLRSDVEKRSAAAGALERARRFAETARDLAQGVGARELEAKALAETASVLLKYESEEASQKAVQLARLAVSITSDQGDLAARLFQLGNAFLIRNDPERAAPLYRDALALAERSADDILAGLCHANSGMAHFRCWRLDAAIDETQRALTIYQRVGHRVRLATAKSNLGGFWVKRGYLLPAEKYLKDVLTDVAGDWILTTACLDSLAQLERVRGREAVAQGHLEEAARISREVGVPQREALYLGLLAESYWASGKASESIASLERAAEVAQAATLSHALVLAQLGAFEQAADLLARFRDANPDPDRKAVARVALARVRWWQGFIPDARQACDDALAILAPTPLPSHVLPAEALSACLEGQIGVALAALRAAQAHCSASTIDEVALDVGALLLSKLDSAEPAHIGLFLALSDASSHRGIRHRIQHIRQKLATHIHDIVRARACAADAHREVRSLVEQLPGGFADVLASTPWVEEILNDSPDPSGAA